MPLPEPVEVGRPRQVVTSGVWAVDPVTVTSPRAAFFAPNVASAVAVSLIFTSLLGARYGMLNYALGFFGLGPIDWLGSAAWLKPSIAMVTIWQWTGYSMIIFLAGLQSINPELYEAARVDGAQTRDIFRHITLPLLRPVIVFQVILSIIGAMQAFDIPVMLAGGTQSSAPGGTTIRSCTSP